MRMLHALTIREMCGVCVCLPGVERPRGAVAIRSALLLRDDHGASAVEQSLRASSVAETSVTGSLANGQERRRRCENAPYRASTANSRLIPALSRAGTSEIPARPLNMCAIEATNRDNQRMEWAMLTTDTGVPAS